ncbi:MAG: asparagine synthase (glutamine-hydrolyzing) [Chlamydiota bacterium]|nr:asparagine synthase (glutamine-hydrolyzing) [Chlamydiota bacterium]
MKGIAGIVYPDVYQVDHLIFPMLDVIQDNPNTQRDVHSFNNIQIGVSESKLAFNEKKTIVCGFHGNIFNARELYQNLINSGHHLASNNHAEILVHAYELWGHKFLEKIDGDFSIVILDPSKERILLARDRIGKYPLYWFHDNNHFIFGSQLKALLSTGVIPQAPAADALATYFYFGFMPQDITPIKKVNKLLPGHFLQYNFNQSKTIEPFWSYSSFFEQQIRKHNNTIAKDLDQLLITSTKKRLPEGNDIGCLISGGLGSATAAYYTKKVSGNRNIQSFSLGFKEHNEEDVEVANAVSNCLGINNQSCLITKDNFLKNIVQIVWHLDEPVADPNIVATWSLADLASKNVNNVFSGMGSDELLAGHNRYTKQEQQVGYLTRLLQVPKPIINQFLVPLINKAHKPFALRLLKQLRTNPWQFDYLTQNSLFEDRILKKVAPKLSGLFDPEVFLHKFHNLSRIKSTLASFMYFDVKTRLADCYILQYERLMQANGLVWNSPFLDQQLIEFLASLADPEQLDADETAKFLKTLMKDVFPKSIVERQKVTRPHLLSDWIEHPSILEVFQNLRYGTLVETGIISEEWLEKVLTSKEERKRSFRYLWSILILEIWFQLFINQPITYTHPKISIQELLVK